MARQWLRRVMRKLLGNSLDVGGQPLCQHVVSFLDLPAVSETNSSGNEGGHPNTSLCALGNQLRPGRNASLPSWISPAEHSPLFWSSGKEGLVLCRNITLASTLFVLLFCVRFALEGLPVAVHETLCSRVPLLQEGMCIP